MIFRTATWYLNEENLRPGAGKRNGNSSLPIAGVNQLLFQVPKAFSGTLNTHFSKIHNNTQEYFCVDKIITMKSKNHAIKIKMSESKCYIVFQKSFC